MELEIVLMVALVFTMASSGSCRRGAARNRPRAEARPISPSVGDVRPSPVNYLEKYGYLVTGATHSSTSLGSAIRVFQSFAGLPETGILDDATREMLVARRCGVEDIIGTGRMKYQLTMQTNGSSVYQRRKRRYTTGGSKWSKTHLTYNLRNFTPDLTHAQTRRAIRRAFQLWADASPLSFSESSDTDADIIIEFRAGVHSDGYKSRFDGPGGTLAHAYFPENGDAHFDEDETFTEGTPEGVNLFIVAAHEFGHSLGLGHSSDRSALMYPWYLGYVADYQLPQDDINGIQYLYGKPDVERDTTLRGGNGNGGNGGHIPPCDSQWDAATYYASNDVVYAFRGKFVWALDEQGVVEGYPVKIQREFPGAPSVVNAVVTSGGRTYMFKGKMIWRFYHKQLESGFPRTKPAALPSSPNAALQWGGNGRIYVFRGSRFYEFFEHDLSVGPSKKIVQHWGGIPVNPDAAVQWKNGKTYFFQGNKYWRFNDHKLAAATGYPKSKSEYWMGCDQRGGRNVLQKEMVMPTTAA